MFKRFAHIVLTALCLAVVFTGCDSGEDDEAPGTVTIQMEHTANGADLTLNNLQYTNAAGNLYSVTLLEYIVTNVALQTARGGTIDIADAQYLNVEEPATLTFSADDVPGGTYTGLTFTYGVDGAENTTGALPNTVDFQGMVWPAQMGGGYHYMRLEGRFQNGTNEGGFAAHTGPTMGNDFSFDVTLPATIRVDGGETTVEVVMDVNEWFGNPNIYDFRDFQGGVMGNANAQNLLQANGMDIFTLGNVE